VCGLVTHESSLDAVGLDGDEGALQLQTESAMLSYKLALLNREHSTREEKGDGGYLGRVHLLILEHVGCVYAIKEPKPIHSQC
jgi:hypothetical protein